MELRELVRRGKTKRALKMLARDPGALDRVWDSPDKLTLLCEAALAGQAELVRALLELGARRDHQTIGPRDGSLWRTPDTATEHAFVDGIKNALVFARMSGDAETYRAMAAHATRDELGLALVAAARRRDAAWFGELVDRGAPIDHELRYDGARPLHTCIQHGLVAGFDRLLAAGVALDVPWQPVEMDPDHDRPDYEDDRLTPIYLACEAGDLHMVSALLAAGAKPDHARDVDATALMVAYERDLPGIGTLLVAHGANRAARCPRFFDGRTVDEEHARAPRPGWDWLTPPPAAGP